MEVTRRLSKVGFKEVQGRYDYSYSWGRRPSVEELLEMGDMVQKALEGTKAAFKMETE